MTTGGDGPHEGVASTRAGRVARAYLCWDRGYDRAQRNLRAFADGVFLGFFTERTLDALDASYYRTTPMYTSDDYNTSGLFDWESRFVREHVPAGGRIAVIAAGGGREVVALRRLGYDAVGWEIDATLRAYADDLLRRLDLGGEVRDARRDEWPADAVEFDAVIVGWGAYHAIRGSAARIRFLEAMRRSLPVGAPVLLSFFARRGSAVPHRVVAGVANTIRLVRRAPLVARGDFLSPAFAHRFDRDDIEIELVSAGFRMVHFADGGYGRAVGIAEHRVA